MGCWRGVHRALGSPRRLSRAEAPAGAPVWPLEMACTEPLPVFPIGILVGINHLATAKAAPSTSARGRFISGFVGEPTVGLEPTTCGLQNRCSAIELRPQTGARSRAPAST